jgi:hypothetical protein
MIPTHKAAPARSSNRAPQVQWLPGAKQPLAGAGNGSYIVDAATLSARPLFFLHSRDHNIQDSQDVNYSAVVITQPG